MAGDELLRRGWHLTDDGVEQCAENGNSSVDVVIKNALNADLRDIGGKWLPEELSGVKGKVDYLQGPAVLQLQKLRNISAPKDNEESQVAPRLWKMTLTDGHTSCLAVVLETLKNLSLTTPPGTKLLLEGTVDVESSYLLLTNKNVRVLGGRVASLADSWELKRKLAQQSRAGIQSEGGPPPFVPFGKKISAVEAPKKDNFKSLAVTKQEKEEEDSEFQQQRQATIAEALTGKAKTFGGGPKLTVQDRDVARIVDMGFLPEQANSALRQAGGNVNTAIDSLLNGNYAGRGRGGGNRGGNAGIRDGRNDGRGDAEERSGSRRGGRGGRGGGTGGRRGRDQEDDDDSLSSRPSGPATLFDFLETKIPTKREKHQDATSIQSGVSVAAQSQKSHSAQQQQNHTRPEANNNLGSFPITNNSANSTSHDAAFTQSKNMEMQNKEASIAVKLESTRNSQPLDSCVHGQQSGARHSQSAEVSSGSKNARDKVRTSGDFQSDDSYGPTTRPAHRPQNLPPRLASRLGRDGNSQNQVSSRPVGSDHQDSDSGSRRTRFIDGARDGGEGGQATRGPLKEKTLNYSGGNYASKNDQPLDYSRDQHHSKYRNHLVPHPRRDYQNPAHNQGYKQEGMPSQLPWQIGQTVLAKYWEDEQLYPAVIEAVAENCATVVVTFIEYGNQEEVFSSDIHPLHHQNWIGLQNNGYPRPPPCQGAPVLSHPPPGYYSGFISPDMPPPPPFPGTEPFGVGTISTMEFRRGGSGPSYRRKEQPERRRPTQAYYTPPPRKKDE